MTTTTLHGWNVTGRFLGTCRSCKTTHRVEKPQLIDFWTTRIVCTCGRSVELTQVAGERSEKKCDGRCIHAKRSSCECSCGGENHGTGW